MRLDLQRSINVTEVAFRLRKLISLCYICPSEETDKMALLHLAWIRAEHSSYQESLHRLSSKSLCQFHKFCHSTDMHCVIIIDKPNIHHLLERFHSTINRVHHAQFIYEMLLEAFHQQFKSTNTRNLSNKANLSAMNAALSIDCFTRLAELFIFRRGTE